MSKNELIKQAQYIFATSTLVRDYIFRGSANKTKININNNKYKELTLAQFMAVMAIDENGPLTITDLAKALRVSNPSASAMVEKLVEKNIVTREHSQEDRRKVTVRISPEAARRIAELKQISLGSFIALVKKVGPETARKWCEVMDEIKRVIEE